MYAAMRSVGMNEDRPKFLVGDVCEMLGHIYKVTDIANGWMRMRRLYVTGEVDLIRDPVELPLSGWITTPEKQLDTFQK